MLWLNFLKDLLGDGSNEKLYIMLHESFPRFFYMHSPKNLRVYVRVFFPQKFHVYTCVYYQKFTYV